MAARKSNKPNKLTWKDVLFIDQDTGKYSTNKLWINIASAITLILFPYAVVYGSKIGYELWLVVMMAFLGNRTINKIAEKKFGVDKEQDK